MSRTDKVIVVGDLQPDNKRPISNVTRSQNLVVSADGISPCLGASFSKHAFSIMEEDKQIQQEVLGWTRDEKGNIVDRHPVEVANCVTASKRDNTQNYVKECTVVTPQRTEEAKQLRRQGIETFAGRQYAPREDGCSGTLTTVAKDNLVMEQSVLDLTNGEGKRSTQTDIAPTLRAERAGVCVKEQILVGRPHGYYKGGEYKDDSPTIRGCIQYNSVVKEQIFLNGTSDGVASTLTTGHYGARNITEPQGGHKQMGVLEKESNSVRVRRLTERELYRLMDLEEEDIDTLLATDIAKTQHSKLAGNSIAVSCLYFIFRNLFIDGADIKDIENTQLTLF